MSADAEREPQTGIAVLTDSLEDTIVRLESGPRTEESRSLLYEAKRLMSVMAKWQAIAPTAEARREMLARVLDLASALRDVSPSLALSDKPASPPRSESHLRRPTPFGVPSPPQTRSTGSSSDVFAIRRSALGPGAFRVRPSRTEWVPMASAPGVSIQRLNVDRGGERQTALIRIDAGSSMPRHKHNGEEELYVLEGAIRMGPVVVEAGDYCHADAGSIHEAARSDAGCLLLVIGSSHDEVLPEPGLL